MNIETKPATIAYKLLIEKDVDVPVRDGARLKADVFRPDDSGWFPAILNLGPYQKDKLWVPPAQLEEKATPNMNWETVTPEWWVPRGYAAVRVDGRGSGQSPGQCEPWSLAEAIDFYDAIEWAAKQPWCNGNVGLSGISYYAINQWFVANLQPPSLKAIVPWEGFADLYRDALYHGGILNVFMTNWFTAHLMHHKLGRASRQVADGWQTNMLNFWLSHNLDTGAFTGAQADWDKITVPFYSVGNWTGFGLHLRGNTEAFMRSKSKHKKLRIHTGSHVHPFYTEEGRQDQVRFFDHWLKGVDNGVEDTPSVNLYTMGADKWEHYPRWPVPHIEYTRAYLAPDKGLSFAKPAEGDGDKAPLLPASSPCSRMTTQWTAGAAAGPCETENRSWEATGLTYTTPPLEKDVKVTGPIVANIIAELTTKDATLDDLPGQLGGVDSPYWLTIADGEVTRVDQQYVP
jgi:predicted acyl esterase